MNYKAYTLSALIKILYVAGMTTVLPLSGATFNYSTGPLTVDQGFNSDIINIFAPANVTFTGTLRNASQINSFGGSSLFSGTLQSGTIMNVQGGFITATGTIQNSVFINQTAGSLNLNTVQNNATFNISGGEIQFNQSVGNTASVNISGGTVILNKDDVFAGSTNVTMSGGTLNTQGYDLNLDTLTLTGNAVLDLGNNPDVVVNVGAISGSGQLTIVNFVTTNQVVFDPTTSNINVGQQVYYGTTPAIVDGNTIIIGTPVIPETGTWIGLSLVLGFALYRERKRFLPKSKADA